MFLNYNDSEEISSELVVNVLTFLYPPLCNRHYAYFLLYREPGTKMYQDIFYWFELGQFAFILIRWQQ